VCLFSFSKNKSPVATGLIQFHSTMIIIGMQLLLHFIYPQSSPKNSLDIHVVHHFIFFTCINFYERAIILIMENTNVAPLKKSSRAFLSFLIFALLIIGGIYLAYNKKDLKKDEVSTLEQTKAALLSNSRFTPVITDTFKNIQVSALPKDIQLLLGSYKEVLFNVRETKYTDNKLAYTIDFVVNTSLAASYQEVSDILVKNKWEITKVSEADTFAFIDAENTKYLLRFSGALISENTIHVLIEVNSK